MPPTIGLLVSVMLLADVELLEVELAVADVVDVAGAVEDEDVVAAVVDAAGLDVALDVAEVVLAAVFSSLAAEHPDNTVAASAASPANPTVTR